MDFKPHEYRQTAIGSRCISETCWEPAEYYSSAESDHYGTDDGGWMFSGFVFKTIL